MKLSSDRLGGQANTKCGINGSSSLPHSANLTKKQRNDLWKKLRKVDKKISKITYGLRVGSFYRYGNKSNSKMEEEFQKLDQQRKEIRIKLKNYEIYN